MWLCQLPPEPRPRDLPVTPDGGPRHAEEIGCLVKGHPAEVFQLDDSCLPFVEGRKVSQGLVESDEVDPVPIGRGSSRIVERKIFTLAAAFVSISAPRVIDEDAPHRLGRDRQEVISVLPLDLAFIDKFYEGFVNKGGRLQRVFRTLVLEVGGGPPAKVLVDTVYHLVERPFISLPPPFKETGDLVGSVRVVIHCHDFTSAGEPRLGRKKYDPADDGLPLIRCNPFWI
jgi:hypothetical protein